MNVKILKMGTHIESWEATLEAPDEKIIFSLTDQEYSDFIKDHIYYKIRAKKLYLDQVLKTKATAKDEADRKSSKALILKTQLCGHKELEEKFIKHGIGTTEIENKISDIQEKIKELEGTNAVQE